MTHDLTQQTEQNGWKGGDGPASKNMYYFDGWQKYWPYEEMPIWLRDKYRDFDLLWGDKSYLNPIGIQENV